MFFNNKKMRCQLFILLKKFLFYGMIDIGVIGQFDKYLQMLNF
jgi:hypothetical protein